MAVLDVQVGASADDGVVAISGSATFSPTTAAATVGQISSIVADSWMRFTGVSALNDATTINSVVVEEFIQLSAGTLLSNIYAEDAAGPAAPTTRADYLGKSRTTAFVAYDEAISDPDDFLATPDITSVIEELLASYTVTAIQIFHQDDGSANNERINIRNYDTNPVEAPRLVVDYTSPITAVSSDQELEWNVQQAIVSDQELEWNVQQAIISDQQLVWDVAFGIPVAAPDQELAWNVQQAIVSDQELAWNVQQQIFIGQQLEWNVLQAITTDQQFAWDIQQVVVSDQQLVWNVLSLAAVNRHRTMRRPRFTVRLLPPLQIAQTGPVVIDLGRKVGLSWQTQLPGGWVSGAVGLSDDPRRRKYAYLPEPVDSIPMGHVAISAGSDPVFEGRVIGDDMPAGVVRGLVVEGYGIGALNDDWLRWTDVEMTTAGRLVTRAIRERAPLLVVASGDDFVDPATYHAPAEFFGASPAQLIAQLSEEGGVGDVLWTYTVYDRQFRFIPYVPPEETTYLVSVDDTVHVSRNYDNLYSGLALEYSKLNGAGSSVIEVENPSVQQAIGFSRNKFLSGSVPSASAARQFLQTKLTEASTEEISVTISRTGGRGLELRGGGERAPWLVKSGEPIEIRGVGKMLIDQTSFDAQSLDLDVVAGKPTLTRLAAIIIRAEETEAALRSKYDLLTKSKATF